MNQFERNLASVAACDAALAAALREAHGSVLAVSPAKNGLPTATAGGKQIHSAYDPVREAETWAEGQAKSCQTGEAVVVLGVGLLYHVEALRKRLPKETPVVVVAPDLSVLRDACACRPLSECVEAVTVAWGGPTATARALADLRRPLRFATYAPAAALHADSHAHIERELRDLVATQAGGQLHVAVVGPMYGGSLPIARYAVSALESLGHRATWIDHSPHHASLQVMDRLTDTRARRTVEAKFVDVLGLLTLARLAEDPPDVVLFLAQAPMHLPALELLQKKKFLTAMWFVENYEHQTYWQQVAGGYEFWFVFQRGACEAALRRAGAKHVSYLPLAADPTVHRPLALSDDDRREFGADVSFVGAGYRNRRNILPALIRPDWTFKLWGDEWGSEGPLLSVLQRGGARIDTETCVKIFNATTVNLNLHSYRGEGLDPLNDSVNPRTFELAASGAFQVVDRRTLLPEQFTETEIATVSRAEDFVPAVKRYLADPDARRAMADAARARVLQDHTYAQRMHTFLTTIGLAHPDRVGSVLRGDRQAGALATHAQASPDVAKWLKTFEPGRRVELKDVAAAIRGQGPDAVLSRDELLLLMLDEYRQETRDLV